MSKATLAICFAFAATAVAAAPGVEPNGRFQIISATVMMISTVEGKITEHPVQSLFKLDTATGDSWQLVVAVHDSGVVRQWQKIEQPAPRPAPSKRPE